MESWWSEREAKQFIDREGVCGGGGLGDKSGIKRNNTNLVCG